MQGVCRSRRSGSPWGLSTPELVFVNVMGPDLSPEPESGDDASITNRWRTIQMYETYLQIRIEELEREADRAATDRRLVEAARAGQDSVLTRLGRVLGAGQTRGQSSAATASATSCTPCSMSDVVTAP